MKGHYLHTLGVNMYFAWCGVTACLRKKAVTIRHIRKRRYIFVWKYSEITGGLLTIAVILYYVRLSVSPREYLKRLSHEMDLASDDIYGYNCSLIKEDWLAAGIAWRVVGAVLFSSGVGVYLLNPPANGKQGSILEEMSQTLLNADPRKPGLSTPALVAQLPALVTQLPALVAQCVKVLLPR